MSQNSGGAGTADSQIVDVFAVEQIAAEVWRACAFDPRGGRMFGGTTIAQLLSAARSSVTGPPRVSSVGIHFVRPADGGVPCEFRVERTYDGRSSATRRVTVEQHGQTVAIGTVAFHTPHETWTHGNQSRSVEPDDLPRTGMPHRARAVPSGAFDIRYHDEFDEGVFVRRLWFRAVDPLPDAVAVHECVLAFFSDLYFFEPVVAQHGFRADDRSIRYGTTQHTMWFHHAPRVDEWLLIESSSPVGAGGRGLVYGQVRSADGLVIATVVQEVAVRMPTGSAPSAHGEAGASE